MQESSATALVYVTGLRGLPSVMGGVETHCEELLPRVAALDPELKIIVLGRRPYLTSGRTIYKSVTVIPLPSPRSQRVEALFSTFLGIWYARWNGGRLLHIHAIGPGLLGPLARLLGLRVVITHHGLDYDRAKWGRFAKLMLRFGEHVSLYSAHKVIAVAPSLAADLAARFPAVRDKVHYVPNGAPRLSESAEMRHEVLARLGLERGGFVLAVGRLVPEKGFDYLIKAYRASGADMMLVIAGGVDHESAFSRALLAQADAKVRFVGLQPRSVIRHLYQSAALFVLPSFHEGLPISALEAGCCQTPMLLSDIKANLDIGLPAENYFPVGDVGMLSAALSRPASDFAIDGESIRRRFDWDDIACRTHAIYRELVAFDPASTAKSKPTR